MFMTNRFPKNILNYYNNKMNKRILIIIVSILTVFLVSTIAILITTRLDVTVPSVKFKFISPDSTKEISLGYSYVYEGDDLIRGSKFGGYGASELKTAKTGEVIEIASKQITSYWPQSHYTYLLINADRNDGTKATCFWAASIWTDENEGLLGKEQSLKEAINEFLFRNVKDRVIEIKCL